jgi:nucleoside-diphosphate-sugar epimerase
MKRYFLTGGSGFLGARLLAGLTAQGTQVTALGRVMPPRPWPGSCTWVQGDLRQPESYAGALRGAHGVIHLAAATGTAPPHVHEQVNALGTAGLVRAAQEADVPRFLLVSSIAAGFTDVRRYPYARAKLAGEETVRRSGLRHVILRPTIILGPGAPVLAGLRRLARLPVVPLFGGGKARVQPIHVDDLAALLGALVADDRFNGETLAAGGPDVVTMKELLQEIRRLEAGRAGMMLPIPVGLPSAILWAAERAGVPLPVTAGQLASFVQDGTAHPDASASSPGARLVPLSTMLQQGLAGTGAA